MTTELAKGLTVDRYRALERAMAREEIAALIRARFEERYLRPTRTAPERHGFTMMAIGCLMIEALESFRCGWPNSRGMSERAFRSFFSHWHSFETFRTVADDFYTHVRCGILHQAETTGGWRIRRRGPLLEQSQRIINATAFLRCLRGVLNDYTDTLGASAWDSGPWQKARRKLSALCVNSGRRTTA
jgi:hypothetical protein